MWNLSPEYIQQVKEELKGRRAAIQARHAEELKSLETDLEEVETLERVAYAVAAKHVLETELATEPSEQEPQVVAELEAGRAIAPEPGAGPGSKGLSRWRMRLDADSATEAD
ncbi:MAG TPA: hypothetical protein VFC56_16455 [Stellaceae bacterium]|nr:hypothetical protein [Stellaceae bacterium]